MQPVAGQAASRRAGRDVPRRGPADFGFVRVTEAQFEARPEQVADGRAELRPLVGRGHQVDAVTEPPGRQRGDGLLEVFVVLAQGEPAVHDEEHVTETVARDRAFGPQPAVGGDRVDTALAEFALPLFEQGPHLGDRPAHPVALESARDPAHVRQPAERTHRSAAEIQDVELHLGRGVQQGQRADQREQHGRLAAARRAGHRRVPGAAGQVDPQRVAALLEGPVHDPEHGVQHLPRVRPGQQLVEGGRGVQRRQPYLVRRRARRPGPGQQAHHGVEQGLAELLARRSAPSVRARRGVPSLAAGRVDELRLDVAGAEAGNPGPHPGPRRPVVRRCGQRPRHVRGLEPGQAAGAILQVAVARLGRQLVGVLDAEHGPRLLRGERAQADAVGQLGVQPAQAALLQPLRGEQQVHAEGTADPPDRDEQVDELRLGRQQLRELVQHDEQARHRRQGHALGPPPSPRAPSARAFV